MGWALGRNGRAQTPSDGFTKTDTFTSVPQRQSEPLGPLLFLNYFDLFIDHLPGELIDCNVHPVMLLAFNEEIVLRACSVRLVVT